VDSSPFGAVSLACPPCSPTKLASAGRAREQGRTTGVLEVSEIGGRGVARMSFSLFDCCAGRNGAQTQMESRPPPQATSSRDADAPKCGVGIVFASDGQGGLLVKGFVPRSTAQNGVIQEGDLLLQVDGTDVQRWPVSQIAPLMLGPPGSSVTLRFGRRVPVAGGNGDENSRDPSGMGGGGAGPLSRSCGRRERHLGMNLRRQMREAGGVPTTSLCCADRLLPAVRWEAAWRARRWRRAVLPR